MQKNYRYGMAESYRIEMQVKEICSYLERRLL